MNFRLGNISSLSCRPRKSEDMQPVIAFLEKQNYKCLVHIEAHLNDRARLEHSYFCHAADWHVQGYTYYVDDDELKI